MKSVRFVLLTVLVLSAFAVPSFAEDIDDDVFSRDPHEAEAASAGVSSVEIASNDASGGTEADVFSRDPYEAEAASAGISSVVVASRTFGDVFGRDPYEAEAARFGIFGAEFAAAGDAAEVTRGDVFGRDPYEFYEGQEFDTCSVC